MSISPTSRRPLRTFGARQKRSEGDDAVIIVLKAHVLFRRVADPDIAGRKINAGNVERREDRQLRPIGSGFNISPLRTNGANSGNEALQVGVIEAALERLAADRMIARRGVGKLQFDAAVDGGGPRRRLKAKAHVVK